ncbi:MAG: aminomethyl transferase family protein [Deltaproteobacteria bacterium]|nr:MAG: aminomethyl transferase family protein [Deltaproteobacteria bacterium]
MHKTPLFASHVAGGADMDTFGDWLLPAAFGTDRDAAVAAEIAAVRAGCGITDLAATSLIAAEGEELRRWLNGMFTNKYIDMEPGQGARSVIVDDRGRVQGLVDWYALTEHRFLGVLEGVDADWFRDRFQMFLMLDDIDVEALDDLSLLHLAGPGTDAVLAALHLPVPPADHAHQAVGDDPAALHGTIRVLRRDRVGLGGADLVVPKEVLDSTWGAAVAAGATPTGFLAMDALRIFAGRPAWPQDGTDKSMVHELRYNEDCVSFTKGCYLGQETINRIERRGGVRKKITRLLLAEDALPPVGATVFRDGQEVGRLTSAARIDGQVWALATLREGCWDDGVRVEVRAGDRSVDATVHPA